MIPKNSLSGFIKDLEEEYKVKATFFDDKTRMLLGGFMRWKPSVVIKYETYNSGMTDLVKILIDEDIEFFYNDEIVLNTDGFYELRKALLKLWGDEDG